MYLIGSDEAGYGPNLGPLVVAVSVWEVEPPAAGEQLYARLSGAVCVQPIAATNGSPPPLAIADSKRLYRPGKGLRHLERGLWPVMGLLDRWPGLWSEVWHALAPGAAAELRKLPWYANYDARAPLHADLPELRTLCERLRAVCDRAEVRLVELAARPIFAGEFNALLGHYGSKGTVLTHCTLELISRVVANLGAGLVSVWCDKHGGRNRYAGALAEHFGGGLVEMCEEGPRQSHYRLACAGRRLEIVFAARGETNLPVALASMTAKYLRELAMHALNAFWCQRVPGLVPTAGYPRDARRFRAAIARAQEQLGIPDRLLWRAR